MVEKYPPAEITKENLPMLVQKALETKKKSNRVIYSTISIYCLVASIILFVGFPLWGRFVIMTSRPMSPEISSITSIVSFVILYQSFLFLLFDFTEIGMRRIFGLSFQDWVFSECVLIINYLTDDDKTRAIREVNSFADSLRSFTRNAYRSKGKMYSEEFHVLQNGRRQIQRMLTFSTKDIAGLFKQFCIAFVNNQDSKAFSAVKKIIDEAKSYGEMQGTGQKILGKLERYPTVVAVIWAIASTIISIILAIILKMNTQCQQMGSAKWHTLKSVGFLKG
jgi:hypothetical protein